MAEDQETIGERVCKTLEDCKKSIGKVFLNEQGHLILNIDEDDTGTDLPRVTTEHFGDQRLKYMLVPIGEDGELRQSPVIIFTPKEENDNEQNNSLSTRPSQRFTPTTAENSHNDPNFLTGSTHRETPLDTQRLEIYALRREEFNAQRTLKSTEACDEAHRAILEAHQALFETHQALLKEYQVRLADVQTRLVESYARLSAANENGCGMP